MSLKPAATAPRTTMRPKRPARSASWAPGGTPQRRRAVVLITALVAVVWLLSLRRSKCPVRAVGPRSAVSSAQRLTQGHVVGQAPLQLPFSAAQARWPAGESSAFPFVSQPAGYNPSRNFTVVLNTFKRRKLLLRALAHYATCGPQVGAIRVVWSEQVPPPQRGDPAAGHFFLAHLPRSRGGYVPVVSYDAHPTTSLNNRFSPLAGLASDAVFSVDDDMLVPCAALGDAFAAWRVAPHALVGFYPRLHEAMPVPPRCSAGQQVARYRYVSAEPALLARGAYSLVLTKAAFLHAVYLGMYTRAMPAGVREHVTAHRECEDIAMAFLVANATSHARARGAVPSFWVRPPFLFWLGAKLDGVGRKGISSGQVRDHHAQRGDCVSHFARFYDNNAVPLVTVPLRDKAPRALAR